MKIEQENLYIKQELEIYKGIAELRFQMLMDTVFAKAKLFEECEKLKEENKSLNYLLSETKIDYANDVGKFIKGQKVLMEENANLKDDVEWMNSLLKETGEDYRSDISCMNERQKVLVEENSKLKEENSKLGNVVSDIVDRMYDEFLRKKGSKWL